MAQESGLLYARLIVWEGDHIIERKQMEKYTATCRGPIDGALLAAARKRTNTGQPACSWHWARRVPQDNLLSGKSKLEIRVKCRRGDGVTDCDAFDDLCETLLVSGLSSKLRSKFPDMLIAFTPSLEGQINEHDDLFASRFSRVLVDKLCIGSDKYSDKMEALGKDDRSFLSRQTDKVAENILCVTHDAAQMSEKYKQQLLKFLDLIDSMNHNKDPQALPDSIALAVAASVALGRKFVECSPEIRSKLEPYKNTHDEALLRLRLLIAKHAFLNYSQQPVDALQHLRSIPEPSSQDLIAAVNTFAVLMQAALPLFDETRILTDAEYDVVKNCAIGTGTSWGVGAVGGVAWWFAVPLAGPVGIVGGLAGLGFAIATAIEYNKWESKQETNPSVLLKEIQNLLQQCALLMLSLVYFAAQMDDPLYRRMLEDLGKQIKDARLDQPDWARAYYHNVSGELEAAMAKLQKGLDRLKIT